MVFIIVTSSDNGFKPTVVNHTCYAMYGGRRVHENDIYNPFKGSLFIFIISKYKHWNLVLSVWMHDGIKIELVHDFLFIKPSAHFPVCFATSRQQDLWLQLPSSPSLYLDIFSGASFRIFFRYDYLFLSACLSVYLFICLFAFLSLKFGFQHFCLFIILSSIYLFFIFVFPDFFLPFSLYISIFLSIYFYTYISIFCLSVCLEIRLPVYLSLGDEIQHC